MKRFRFRLAKILNYKSQIEDRKKQILTERNNELNAEKGRLHKIDDVGVFVHPIAEGLQPHAGDDELIPSGTRADHEVE